MMKKNSGTRHGTLINDSQEMDAFLSSNQAHGDDGLIMMDNTNLFSQNILEHAVNSGLFNQSSPTITLDKPIEYKH